MLLSVIAKHVIIFTGVVLLADKSPIWCIVALMFVVFDDWDLVSEYIKFKKHMKSVSIKIPKNISEEEMGKTIDEEIKKLLREE